MGDAVNRLALVAAVLALACSGASERTPRFDADAGFDPTPDAQPPPLESDAAPESDAGFDPTPDAQPPPLESDATPESDAGLDAAAPLEGCPEGCAFVSWSDTEPAGSEPTCAVCPEGSTLSTAPGTLHCDPDCPLGPRVSASITTCRPGVYFCPAGCAITYRCEADNWCSSTGTACEEP